MACRLGEATRAAGRVININSGGEADGDVGADEVGEAGGVGSGVGAETRWKAAKAGREGVEGCR